MATSLQDRVQIGREAMAKASQKHTEPLAPHQSLGEGRYLIQSSTVFGRVHTVDLNEWECSCDGHAWLRMKGSSRGCKHLRGLKERYGVKETDPEPEWPEVTRQTPPYTGTPCPMPPHIKSTDMAIYDRGLELLFEQELDVKEQEPVQPVDATKYAPKTKRQREFAQETAERLAA